ncbi:MAG: hypothetical protein ACKVP0_00500 [Pirellulaceae bacterium]
MPTANTTTLEEARAAKPKAAALLAALPVVGVGITRIGDGYGLKVNLSEIVATGAVPEQVDGVPIKTEMVGTIRKR